MKWAIYKTERGIVLLPENRMMYFFWAMKKNIEILFIAPLFYIPFFGLFLDIFIDRFSFGYTHYHTTLKGAKKELKERQC